MGELRFGPARVPSRESPEAAVELLLERGHSACEIDFEGKFWMDYPWAERFGQLARENSIVLSVHAPIAGFMGHVERDKKQRMAVGMLDHSAGIAKAAGAEVVVFAISARLGWVRPVIDFAHLHAVTDGAFLAADDFQGVLEVANEILEPEAPFHVHFSDIAYANRNETKHLPYGEGTLRAAPLAEALAEFDRPATVISESPDEESHQAIREALVGSASRTP